MQVAVRLEPETAKRLDAYVERLKAGAPAGLSITRSDAVRVALLRGLDAIEAEATKPPRK